MEGKIIDQTISCIERRKKNFYAEELIKKLLADNALKTDPEVVRDLNSCLEKIETLHSGYGLVLRRFDSPQNYKMVYSLIISSQPIEQEFIDSITEFVKNEGDNLLNVEKNFEDLTSENFMIPFTETIKSTENFDDFWRDTTTKYYKCIFNIIQRITKKCNFIDLINFINNEDDRKSQISNAKSDIFNAINNEEAKKAVVFFESFVASSDKRIIKAIEMNCLKIIKEISEKYHINIEKELFYKKYSREDFQKYSL